MAACMAQQASGLDGIIYPGGRDDFHGHRTQGRGLADAGPVLRRARPHGAPPDFRCPEDKATAISTARAGYSPALRHLPRTERISAGVFYEILVKSGGCTLQYQASGEHMGDMFTKRLDPATFEAAIKRASIRRMK